MPSRQLSNSTFFVIPLSATNAPAITNNFIIFSSTQFKCLKRLDFEDIAGAWTTENSGDKYVNYNSNLLI